MQYPAHQLAHHRIAQKRISAAAMTASHVWRDRHVVATVGIDPVLKSNNPIDYFSTIK